MKNGAEKEIELACKKENPNCGCEFKYEQEDVKVDSSACLTTYPAKYGTYVICPCCGKHLHHGYVTATITNYPNTNYTVIRTGVKDLDCDNCPNRPDNR